MRGRPIRSDRAANATTGVQILTAFVQQTFGPPARRATDADKGSVWSYFFLEYGVHRRARIHFDAGGNVARVDVAEDPAADDRYR